jgi:hypothetical protein
VIFANKMHFNGPTGFVFGSLKNATQVPRRQQKKPGRDALRYPWQKLYHYHWAFGRYVGCMIRIHCFRVCPHAVVRHFDPERNRSSGAGTFESLHCTCYVCSRYCWASQRHAPLSCSTDKCLPLFTCGALIFAIPCHCQSN